ncbi:MAG: hypothetical protein PHU82_00625 [Candidatus Pacebacteria bacterium]|jgi:hypothetical protein|nr:hypothetical protein [Candidatus Paceibacterota bacterium]MDD4994620.1 hypothetical protein [Candidatus Paceibacterota bacterium]MDD5535260.1 hypothetical protein [Candidatus Paceibacterota bacterium]
MRRTRNALRVFWFRLQLLFIVFFIIFLLGFIYWVLFISSHFQIQDILIEGYNPSLATRIDLYLQQKNTRFVPFFAYAIFPEYLRSNKSALNFYYSDLEESLLRSYPDIEKIDILLNLKTKVLAIKIRQRKIDFLWCLQQEPVQITDDISYLESRSSLEETMDCYYMDKYGVIFEQAPRIQGSFLNKIVILETKKRALGTKVISQEKLAKLNEAFLLSETEESPISINYLEIKTENSSEIKLVTDEGFQIFYNLDDDFSEMLKIVAGIKEQQLKGSFINLQYIDYRYPPKVYYKINR